MVRNRKQKGTSGGSDLLNFHFTTPAPQQQSQNNLINNNSFHTKNRQRRSNQQQYKRSKEDRASARKKASSKMFHLHSSPDHAFIITRLGPDQSHSFNGSDEPVSWEAVRVVKCLSAIEHGGETCPICLDTPVCPRITKCGHTYCLTCILHHMQSFSQAHPYAEYGPTCPCCSLPLNSILELRPVQYVSVTPVKVGQYITLQKLHRSKSCPSPYLPLVGEPRRESPHAAPCQTDPDAPFSRFNYVDPDLYHGLLVYNLEEISRMEVNSYDPVEAVCQHLALEHVGKEIKESRAMRDDERECMARWMQPTSGLYCSHPKQLLRSNYCHLSEERVLHLDCSKQNAPASPRSFGRPRSESIDCESHSNLECRKRGDSIISQDDTIGSQQSSQQGSKKQLKASLFLDQDESAFYQTTDGKLCFLSGFNTTCLKTNFSSELPVDNVWDTDLPAKSPEKVTPLPDTVQGKVLDITRVHVSPEQRQRLRFLAHVPLYTDVEFVELSLGILSQETKQRFAKEFAKRKRARQKSLNAEKKVDEQLKRQEEARIDELKSRIQKIDPEDDFFHGLRVPDNEVENVLTGEAFGPALGGTRSSAPTAQDSAFSFSAVTRSSGAFPALATDNEQEFPSLGGLIEPAISEPGLGEPSKPKLEKLGGKTSLGKRGGKGRQKKLLFSTGGGHAY